MNSQLPSPEDYIVDYSPIQPAELVKWIVDERPKSTSSLRGLARRLKVFTHQVLTGRRDDNDTEAEAAWKTIEKKWGIITLDTIAQFLTEKYSQTDYLRKFEYPFLARCLARPDVHSDIIVDMGGGNSYSTVVPMLFRFPSAQIFSVDVVNHSRSSKYNVKYMDCTNTNLPSEVADVVTIISTLEHVGLGRWGDPLDVDGDIRAMGEAWRILKLGGHVVLTIPYGFPTVVYNLHRIYDTGRVSTLTKGFDIVHAEYSLLGRAAIQSEIEGVKLVPSIPGVRSTVPLKNGMKVPEIPGGAMFLLQKKALI
jgi:hypothetical protein